jgi:endonuclease/exonuclease/phosphatase (EEP) superfamily protein YafD
MSKRVMNAKALRGEHILIGHAVFSKYPLQNDIRYPLDSSYYNLLSMDVIVDSARIFNLNVTHLASVRFAENDINYIESLKEKGTQVEINQKSKSIIYRLRNAFSMRARQANLIDSIKDETDYPIIICGDFNDVPGSYVYQKVKGDLQDPFVTKGFGFGRTYRNIMPTLRIDYILFDGEHLQPKTYRSPNVNLSDHRPVIVDFSFK